MSKISTPPLHDLLHLTSDELLEFANKGWGRLDLHPLVGLTAGQALERLEACTPAGRAEIWQRITEAGLPSAPKQGPLRRLVGAARTWLRRRLCPHTNATAEKLALLDAGMTALYRCHCEACGRIWMEVGR